jgi:hypothetical protein
MESGKHEKDAKQKFRLRNCVILCGVLMVCVLFRNHLPALPQPQQQESSSSSSSLRTLTLPRYSTPGCKPHPTECKGLCETVAPNVKRQRDAVLSNPKSWLNYYQGVLEYYRCTNAEIVVEVGVAFGAQTAYHLKNADFIKEYHVVDPFMAGYDPEDPMSKLFEQAAPGSTPDDISVAWADSMAKALGVDGEYLDTGMTPASCKLRMHRVKSHEGAALFGDHSVDAVFIDGLHTYEGVIVDIEAWVSKIRIGGSLIFNDYNAIAMFPGVSKAVKEEAARQNIQILMLDGTNALGGKKECAKGPPPPF